MYAVIRSVPMFKQYWNDQAQKEVPDNAIRLVALGDSTMQGIGASKPGEGVVGLIADYIQSVTGRPVHITNISVSGARVKGALSDQLPKFNTLSPDIVIVSISANDANNMVDKANFERDINELYAALPSARTVVSDVPGVDHRDDYQPILLQAANKRNLHVAPVYETFRPHENSFSAYAGDFFHPSSKGYAYWFDAYKPYVDKILENNRTTL